MWLLLAAAGLVLACDDDDPAPQTGGLGGAVDAGARDLPGEGLEATPDFDTNTQQREPIGPQRVVDNVDRIRRQLDPNYGYDTPDAGDTGDAGAPDAG